MNSYKFHRDNSADIPLENISKYISSSQIDSNRKKRVDEYEDMPREMSLMMKRRSDSEMLKKRVDKIEGINFREDLMSKRPKSDFKNKRSYFVQSNGKSIRKGQQEQFNKED